MNPNTRSDHNNPLSNAEITRAHERVRDYERAISLALLEHHGQDVALSADAGFNTIPLGYFMWNCELGKHNEFNIRFGVSIGLSKHEVLELARATNWKRVTIPFEKWCT